MRPEFMFIAGGLCAILLGFLSHAILGPDPNHDVNWTGRKLITVDMKADGQCWTLHDLEYGTTPDGLIVTRKWEANDEQ